LKKDSDKNILVTGGAGYIGSHTCKKLVENGYFPIIYDNFSTGNKWAVKWGYLEEGDILDLEKLINIIRKHKPSVVIHLAAKAYIGESINYPEKYFRNNVVGSINLLEAMKKTNTTKIVFSSSCATYGIPKDLPILESEDQVPISPYGTSKHVIEQIINSYSQSDNLNFINLRYFNAAGADLDCEIGEFHDPEPHLIPSIFEALLKNKEFVINGSDYRTYDGTCIRDFIHVEDLANAHVKSIDNLLKSRKNFSFNLGTGRGYSILEVIKEVEKITNRTLKIKISERRVGDPPKLFASGRLAKKELGWDPSHSDLNEILKTAWNWYLKINSTYIF
tara:strand:- start:2989 stop:3990 length:1002 start_codon:yes stop_codon:yes gene_type:complete